jgi:hypothetical protein
MAEADIEKVSVMIRLGPNNELDPPVVTRMTDYARRINANGFPGIGVEDSIGRAVAHIWKPARESIPRRAAAMRYWRMSRRPR